MAFTLAEVLITLGIIGLVASMTIPTLMNNIQDTGLTTALKKTYSQIYSVTNSIIQDNGGSFKGISDLLDSYTPYFKTTKTCTNARSQGCWHPLNTNNGTWKSLDGSPTDGLATDSGIILNDGELVNFATNWSDCNSSSWYNTNSVCGWIIVDVNGFKPPNITGRDIFYFYILENKLEPWGSANSASQTCGGSGIMAGIFCTTSKLN